MSHDVLSNLTNSGDAKRRFSVSGVTIVVLILLFVGYVLSAPLLHDERGLPLQIHKPVWSAAMEGPFSPVLRPYFKLCGIEFQQGPPEPARPMYE